MIISVNLFQIPETLHEELWHMFFFIYCLLIKWKTCLYKADLSPVPRDLKYIYIMETLDVIDSVGSSRVGISLHKSFLLPYLPNCQGKKWHDCRSLTCHPFKNKLYACKPQKKVKWIVSVSYCQRPLLLEYLDHYF